jgi:hypothetical protein
LLVAGALAWTAGSLDAQGVTTAAMSGIVTDTLGNPLPEALVVAVHVPTNTRYQAVVRTGGLYNLPNMRVGGPYTVTVRLIGYAQQEQQNVVVSLGQNLRLDFRLAPQAIQLAAIQVTAEEDEILNADRTGAATFIGPDQVNLLPSIKRSTRDLIRMDPRNDGNYAFGGRNWLYNNISLDGSYFNNSFGLDDPAPGGQTNAEPVPFDAVEEVQVSIAPFDVRQGGFTGANVNTVTKSGTNQVRGSVYSFYRSQAFQGNEVSGSPVVANPDLTFLQSGASLGGPIIRDKLFFFVNAEIERTDDPGTNFVASTGTSGLGISRVQASIMDSIRNRMMQAYNYDPGAYQGFVHQTDNNKLLAKLDWNINDNNSFWLRYNYLDAKRDLPPHPFVLSFANSGRGPNSSSLPFQNSGYAINNEMHSFAMELNSLFGRFGNRFFASYNRFRDFREPFSTDFPTVEIGEGGVTYTTVGHEPFSIHNILDTDVLQLTDNFSYFTGRHVLTFGANFERFSFFNSFNIFRHGVFFLPAVVAVAGGTTFSSLDEFFQATDPSLPPCNPFGSPPTNPTVDPCQVDFRSYTTASTVPFKGEKISVGQVGLYVQDELALTNRFSLTAGVRVDFPMYFTDPVANPFSTSLTALDENGSSETVDQASLPGITPLFSPRVGFNYDVTGDRSTQIRGGTGIFTGRVPMVWVGNVISNPGANPNLWAPFSNEGVPQIPTSDDAILQQSFDLNAMDPNFKWPQVWTTNVAIDHRLPGDVLGTLEFIYGKDLNSIFMRNADLVAPVRNLPAPDGRPYYGGFGANELNSDGGAGIYVIDNTSEGYNYSITAQLRKAFTFGLNAQLSYSFTEAKNNLKSTEIASVLWQNQPVRGDPNNPELSHSEFGQRHRIVGGATYAKVWSDALRTQIGVFLEIGQGNRFAGAGGNRYSFIYSGDVNGDGYGGNDMIYIPSDQGEIILDDITDPNTGAVIKTAQQQWQELDAFIAQDKYLSAHRGLIAERHGALNPFYQTIDLRVLQDFAIQAGGTRHGFQLSVDVLNVANLVNSGWGVRKVATPAATSPLSLTQFDAGGAPHFNFTGPSETYIDDPSLLSRWRVQVGLRYLFN